VLYGSCGISLSLAKVIVPFNLDESTRQRYPEPRRRPDAPTLHISATGIGARLTWIALVIALTISSVAYGQTCHDASRASSATPASITTTT
jgi:hypothetical protein